MDFTDPDDDLMEPVELIDAIRGYLLDALTSMNHLRRVLQDAGDPRQERRNQRPRKRGAYPRRVE